MQAADFTKKLSERLPQYKGRWKNSLAEQIKDLPAFEQVEREVQRHLKICESSRKKHPVLTILYFFSCSFKRLAVNFICGKAWDRRKKVAVIRELPASKRKK